jgi:ribonuclease HI
MFDWDKAINERFDKKENTFKILSEAIDEVMSEISSAKGLTISLTEDLNAEPTTITWSSIPEVPISEIGWSAMETRDGEQVPSEQRAQLDQFLSQISPGGDLSGKLKDLSDFYKMDESVVNSFKGGDIKENIGRAMAYLVFFKTLTQILTHFNAASAGFAFESFLAVLLGGEQIATNSQTIADLLDANKTPISLKLYKEKQLEVGGSFTDLALDLAKDNWNNTMQYICVTKDFDKDTEGMHQAGTLNWYRFNFNLDNVFNIIARSSKNSQKCILLPKSFMESNGQDTAEIPGKDPGMPAPEQVEVEFLEILEKEIAANREAINAQITFEWEALVQALDFAKNDELFSATTKRVRGKSALKKTALTKILAPFFRDEDFEGLRSSAIGAIIQNSEIYQAIGRANSALLNRYTRDIKQKERQNKINDEYFYKGVSDSARIEISRAFYEKITDPELKKKCLMVSHGYVNTGHFNLTQGMLLKIDAMAAPTPGQLFPEGQSAVAIGQIAIGTANVMNVLKALAGVLNDNIFEIFNNLKTLTTNIQGYFAGGLQDTEKATTAITAADNIETKTSEIAGVPPASTDAV